MLSIFYVVYKFNDVVTECVLFSDNPNNVLTLLPDNIDIMSIKFIGVSNNINLNGKVFTE